jgi:dTDP-4-dehydrorhamnose reductase
MLGKDLLSILSVKHKVVGKNIEDFDFIQRKRTQEEISSCRLAVVIKAAAYNDVDGANPTRTWPLSSTLRGLEMLPWHVPDRESP